MSIKDSLGDRMKRYESVPRLSLSPRIPVIVRLDGKAFHTFTRKFRRPFDHLLQETMVAAAKAVAAEMQGFKLAYTQSDEVSFVMTDYDTLETSPWFDYDQQKLSSVAASIMTAHFNQELRDRLYTHNRLLSAIPREMPKTPAYFDGRSYNVPREDVANYFLWRAKDWERNSLTMYASSFFSHKELHGKSKQGGHDLLHSIGKNWATDVDERSKNGTFFTADGKEHFIPATYEHISKLVFPLVNPTRDPGDYDEMRPVYDLSKLKVVPKALDEFPKLQAAMQDPVKSLAIAEEIMGDPEGFGGSDF